MAAAEKTNLFPSATRFIGREQELSRLAGLVAEGQRLVTIYGPAGTGKTRLAEALGVSLRGEMLAPGGGGIWICELAEVTDAEGICAVVGRVLGVPPHPATAPHEAAQRLGRAIAARGPILLVLDNFEHLVEHAASTVAPMRDAAPDARFVVTSREPLRLDGEARFPLEPLSLPGASGSASGSDAIALFVDRVRMRDPAFALDASSTPVVASIVTRLEGIPLALELAASRVELLGLPGLAEALDRQLEVLVHDRRDAKGRHATLRAAIESSWGSLHADEARVLAQCAVFRGGFFAPAAAAVLGPAGDRGDPLRLLQSLRDKSLLRRYELADRPGRPRFGLFEAVRELASERLEAADREAVQARHAAFFLGEAEAAAARVIGPGGAEALAELSAERDNLLEVHRWALERGAIDDALRCALALDALAAIRGPFVAHLALLERTLEAARSATPDRARWARALRARAKARSLHGQHAAALRDLDAALAAAEEARDESLQAEVLVDLAIQHHQRREISTAGVLYERALAHARGAEARHVEGRILGNLGALHHDRRRFDDASSHYREALAILQEIGDQRLEAIHVANLGILEQERGERARARAHFEAALDLLARLGDRRLEAIVLGNLGTLEHEEGHLPVARQAHERALRILREVGDRRSEALCLGRLCRANAALGWVEDARTCVTAAERWLGRWPDPLVSATIELDRAFLEIAEARSAAANGNPEASASALQSVRARLSAARAPAGDDPAWIDRSDDIRAGVRLLEAELDAAASGPEPAAARRGAALAVGPDASWLQVPGEEPQDLRRRKALRSILLRLVEQQRGNPGAGVSLDQLLAAGWPGERMVPSAGANRVYVALTTLRKLGLRKYLLSQDDGYLLDPALPVENVQGELAGT